MQNPKIKIVKSGIKINSSDFPIDPSRQNQFMQMMQQDQNEIERNENNFTLGPYINGLEVNFQYWQFSFEGKGIFEGKKISGVLKFPPEFPAKAPKFYFDPLPNGDVIQHFNIYGVFFAYHCQPIGIHKLQPLKFFKLLSIYFKTPIAQILMHLLILHLVQNLMGKKSNSRSSSQVATIIHKRLIDILLKPVHCIRILIYSSKEHNFEFIYVLQSLFQKIYQQMSNNPKIKLISPSTKSGGIKFNSPDFQIDPNRQNEFMSLLDADQQEINLTECQYNLSPQKLNNTYNFQYWQFEFVGKGNFQGRKISGVLKFPSDFPKSAPKFFFDPLPKGEVIQHHNIYGDNLLCIPLLKHWNTQTSTMEILQAIEHIFANPNWGEGDAPANPSFSAKSEAERDNIQKVQAQFLPWFVKE